MKDKLTIITSPSYTPTNTPPPSPRNDNKSVESQNSVIQVSRASDNSNIQLYLNEIPLNERFSEIGTKKNKENTELSPEKELEEELNCWLDTYFCFDLNEFHFGETLSKAALLEIIRVLRKTPCKRTYAEVLRGVSENFFDYKLEKLLSEEKNTFSKQVFNELIRSLYQILNQEKYAHIVDIIEKNFCNQNYEILKYFKEAMVTGYGWPKNKAKNICQKIWSNIKAESKKPSTILSILFLYSLQKQLANLYWIQDTKKYTALKAKILKLAFITENLFPNATLHNGFSCVTVALELEDSSIKSEDKFQESDTFILYKLARQNQIKYASSKNDDDYWFNSIKISNAKNYAPSHYQLWKNLHNEQFQTEIVEFEFSEKLNGEFFETNNDIFPTTSIVHFRKNKIFKEAILFWVACTQHNYKEAKKIFDSCENEKQKQALTVELLKTVLSKSLKGLLFFFSLFKNPNELDEPCFSVDFENCTIKPNFEFNLPDFLFKRKDDLADTIFEFCRKNNTYSSLWLILEDINRHLKTENQMTKENKFLSKN